MTKEELEKEAEEFAKRTYLLHQDGLNARIDGYIAGAEPREKRIAELERKLKIETELSNRLGLAYREYEQLTKEQDEHLAELEAQIEKMKCCQNCENWNWKHNKCEKKLKGDCFKASKWQLRR